jgi:hypothetical protein
MHVAGLGMLYMPDMEIAADSDLERRGLRLLLAVVG